MLASKATIFYFDCWLYYFNYLICFFCWLTVSLSNSFSSFFTSSYFLSSFYFLCDSFLFFSASAYSSESLSFSSFNYSTFPSNYWFFFCKFFIYFSRFLRFFSKSGIFYSTYPFSNRISSSSLVNSFNFCSNRSVFLLAYFSTSAFSICDLCNSVFRFSISLRWVDNWLSSVWLDFSLMVANSYWWFSYNIRCFSW